MNLPNTIQGRSCLTGNSPSFLLEAPYPQLREWAKNRPNQDLIRYYLVANLERVILTSPKALGELLVTKVYDFEKPELVRQSLRRITGDGVLLAEGEEHKVNRPFKCRSTWVQTYNVSTRRNARISCQPLPIATSRTSTQSFGARV
jgi:hypothetical protein